MTGYCLTGSTREHALFFLHGSGANGKSVFLTTISGVLGEYATTAPIETFTASNQERHPTDLAMLRGARLVAVTETEEGRRWAEAKIKQLTGGDRISARFMRQDFFQFTPGFKFVIAGNHKPSLRSVDEAIRRRLHLVFFAVTIPEDERDPELAEKLKAEWPGILLWAIDGCHLWAEQGLDPPDSVRAATDAYLEAEDAVTTWIDDCCERGSYRMGAGFGPLHFVQGMGGEGGRIYPLPEALRPEPGGARRHARAHYERTRISWVEDRPGDREAILAAGLTCLPLTSHKKNGC